MTAIDLLNLAMRWLHILAGMAAAGGTVFARFAYHPALPSLPDDLRAEFAAAVRRRWSKVVMISIAVLLVSGLYNIGMIEAMTTAPQVYSWYRPLFIVKFLLAMAVFTIASLLSGRTAAADKIRQRATFWLNVNLTLIVAIVMISGVLRTADKQLKPPRTPAAAKGATDTPSP
jgi:uncharacterized membrane protein